jgi:non-heme chloroperoxidase
MVKESNLNGGQTGLRSEVRHVRFPGAPTLETLDIGERSAPAILLLHGVTDSWRSFEPVAERLASRFRVVAPSQRGHGRSDKPMEGYRTRDFAADAIALADALGLHRFAVVGHSMGAANALRLAIENPGRVAALALVGGFARFATNAAVLEFYEGAIRGLRDPIDEAVAREFQASTLTRAIDPEFFEMVVRESLSAPAHVWRSCFEGFLEDDFADELALVRAPTLLLWGDRDAFVPRGDQDALLAGIAGSRLRVYEGVGHGLHWEEPERFVRDVEGLLETSGL